MAERSMFSDLTFLGSSHRLARYIGRPIHRFLAVETAGGIMLLLATFVALIWVNTPWSASYFNFWETEFAFEVGPYHFESYLEGVVDDGLMAIFFFVVGLEIKRELVVGQLRNPRFAALPAVAALGGMVVPALIFWSFNAGGEGADGWGIPMATDIAFAVGVVSLLGDRVSRTLKVFLLTLAIVDDVGAILVIAIFYTSDLSTGWLLTSVVIFAGIALLRWLGVWYLPLYIVAGVAFWLAVHESGVHATIAGVFLGLMTPAKPLQSDDDARRWAKWLETKETVTIFDMRRAGFHIRESRSVCERVEEALHPLTSYIIIPIFALANAGVELSGGKIADAVTAPVTLGVVAGLVVGKIAGITLFSLGAEKMGFVHLPDSMNRMHLLGLSSVAGIGFTVSIFITGLAFEDNNPLAAEAKIGILVASLIAALIGLGILSRAAPTSAAEDDHYVPTDLGPVESA